MKALCGSVYTLWLVLTGPLLTLCGLHLKQHSEADLASWSFALNSVCIPLFLETLRFGCLWMSLWLVALRAVFSWGVQLSPDHTQAIKH